LTSKAYSGKENLSINVQSRQIVLLFYWEIFIRFGHGRGCGLRRD